MSQEPSPSQSFGLDPSLSRKRERGYCFVFFPSPTKWEREGPMAQPWEGEGW
jgi:hypothetical protein